jgi:hypothetical protein
MADQIEPIIVVTENSQVSKPSCLAKRPFVKTFNYLRMAIIPVVLSASAVSFLAQLQFHRGMSV